MKQVPLGDEYRVKLAALHASKTIGENVVDISRSCPEMAHTGLYRELDPLDQAEKLDWNQYFRGAVENGRFDGKLYALPETYQYQVMLVYYNKAMFRS